MTSLDLDEQVARIDRELALIHALRAHDERLRQQIWWQPWHAITLTIAVILLGFIAGMFAHLMFR